MFFLEKEHIFLDTLLLIGRLMIEHKTHILIELKLVNKNNK